MRGVPPDRFHGAWKIRGGTPPMEIGHPRKWLGEHAPKVSRGQNDRTDIGNTWGTLWGPKNNDFPMIFWNFWGVPSRDENLIFMRGYPPHDTVHPSLWPSTGQPVLADQPAGLPASSWLASWQSCRPGLSKGLRPSADPGGRGGPSQKVDVFWPSWGSGPVPSSRASIFRPVWWDPHLWKCSGSRLKMIFGLLAKNHSPEKTLTDL